MDDIDEGIAMLLAMIAMGGYYKKIVDVLQGKEPDGEKEK